MNIEHKPNMHQYQTIMPKDCSLIKAITPYVYLCQHVKYGECIIKFALVFQHRIALRNEIHFYSDTPLFRHRLLEHGYFNLNKGQQGIFLIQPHFQGTPLNLAHVSDSKIITSLEHQIQSLHNLGFIHADIKPSNIIVTEQSATLIDFGTVCPINSKVTSSCTQLTPRYASFEQRHGHQLTAYTDWVALAKTFRFLKETNMVTVHIPTRYEHLIETDLAKIHAFSKGSLNFELGHDMLT
ncbi:AarF/UbiB family protein [Vibrio sp.]|nr:AarF/UbiB family protein [Vibrio sp.]